MSFYNWALENGYRDDLTIDRINPKYNYEPNNCRWISKSQNSMFKSTTNSITICGITKSGNGWSKYINKSKNYINKMVKKYGIEHTKKYLKENI